MQMRVYHGSKSKARHQFVEAIDETAIYIRNEVGCMEWQHSVA
jgi:hypothetical protein